MNFDAFGLEQLAQFLDLLLEFANEFRVGVLINDGFANDLLGSVGVPGGRLNYILGRGSS